MLDIKDLKEKIDEVVSAIKADPEKQKAFQNDPVAAVEESLGVELPDDVKKKIVSGVQTALAGDKLSGAADVLKKLF